MRRQSLLVLTPVLLVAVLSVVAAAPAYGEVEVLNLKAPAKIVVHFQASKDMQDNVTSLSDSMSQTVKTPVEWIFSTDDVDHFNASLTVKYGNVTVSQTLTFGIYSGGELIVQRYVPVVGKTVSLRFDITTSKSVRYPTTDEIVAGVIKQTRSDMQDLTGSIIYTTRTFDNNEKIMGVAIIGFAVFSAILTSVIVLLIVRIEDVRKQMKKEIKQRLTQQQQASASSPAADTATTTPAASPAVAKASAQSASSASPVGGAEEEHRSRRLLLFIGLLVGAEIFIILRVFFGVSNEQDLFNLIQSFLQRGNPN